MQTISLNPITQGEHGQFHAVDIAPSLDIYYYAPEDGTITGVGDSGTCGFRLGMDGPTGAHGFCHNEEIYVSVGQRVKRGQKLAKMGYTGYTIPDGPQGRHVHWVINRNGTYVYPLNFINEAFIKGEVSMINDDITKYLYGAYLGREPNKAELDSWRGRDTNTLVLTLVQSPEANAYYTKVQSALNGTGNFKPYDGASLYVKKG